MKSEKLKIKKNAGMTYVEIIVVLSIFSIMSGAVIYNYHAFQSKIDTKNLASDIATKIVEAQKSALSGKLPALGSFVDGKPSYGIHFYSLSTPQGKTIFHYFKDLDRNHIWSNNSETLETITLPKNIVIEKIESYQSETEVCVFPNCIPLNTAAVNITFSRPSSSAVLYYNGAQLPTDVSYIQIKVKSPDGSSNAVIKVYKSGRIQVN